MATSSGLAPVVTATGISAGTYAQWLAYFEAQYLAIFGADAYLGNDSQDVQMMSVYALACADACNSAIAVYNSFSPATAQGAGLSSVVKINGLARLVATVSTVPLTLVGVAGAVITNGVAIDTSGVFWNLPASVTIPLSGTITVLSTCAVPGTIMAVPGTVTGIQTATLGWQSVTNGVAAAPGAPVETDAQLRIRQGLSVAIPSVTVFSGILASVRALPGVTRARGIENNTVAANSYGIPARCLDFIVEGGVPLAIFQAIAAKITPGVPTFGSNSMIVPDNDNSSTRVINYETAVSATFAIVISLKGLPGWSVSTEPVLQNALIAYLQGLPIGANVSLLGGIVPIANLAGTIYAPTFNILGITLKKNALAAVSTDVQLNYNEAAVSAANLITFVVT